MKMQGTSITLLVNKEWLEEGLREAVMLATMNRMIERRPLPGGIEQIEDEEIETAIFSLKDHAIMVHRATEVCPP